jgi:SAM-dependent methyltransferase
MDRQRLVSVVTIFFNEEKFIEEAVESVFAQKYGNWELLLVDDGSTDKSTEIARRFAEKHPERVRYFEHGGHKNRGPSASRNLGIRNAVGEYIAFLDADDVWLPHKLERQVAILDSQPGAAMVFGTTQYWYSWTGSPEDRERDFVPDLGVEPDKLFRPPTLLTLLHPLGQATAPCPSDLLVRREVIEHIGSFEDEFRGMYEDQVFLVKAYLKEAVFVSSECWDRYRIHPSSCVSVTERAGESNSARKLFLDWFQTYLFKTGIIEARVWAALQNALWPYQQSNRSGTQIYNVQDSLRETEIREIKWWLRIATGTIANLEFVPDNRDIVKIAIKKTETGATSDIQLNQPRLKVKARHRYVINFLARADSSRSIFLGFAKGHAPWSNLGLYSKIELTPEWQHFAEDFMASEDEDNARIHFDMGNSAISVELATVTLRSLSEGRFVDPDLPSLQIAQSEEDNEREARLLKCREQLAEEQKSAVRQQTAGNEAPEKIGFGTLRRVVPVSQDWGWDRGLPIDRYYIENFLAHHREDICGRVLEIGDDLYTRKFGGDRVTSKDVLHVVKGNAEATIVADLTCADHIPSDTFDCILLTQTLQYIYDTRAALKTLHRILKPGGVLLATFPGMSGLRHDEWAGWFWGFTSVSARRLFEEVFPGNKVMIQAYGNVLVAISFLHGLAVKELRQEELDYRDSRYEILITVRAVKPDGSITQALEN